MVLFFFHVSTPLRLLHNYGHALVASHSCFVCFVYHCHLCDICVGLV